MRDRTTLAATAFVTVGALLGWPAASGRLAFGQEAQPRLAVPAREGPVPSTVSPELQTLLATPVAPLKPAPTTAEGWKKLQREMDAAAEKLAREVAERLVAKVEPAEVAV